MDQPVSNLSSWVNQSANDLIVTVSDHTSVNFDGKYTVTHRDGKSLEFFYLLICNIKRPASGLVFQAGTIEPFAIVRQDTGSLTISLEPYTMTNDSDCGQVVYSASSISGHDPLTAGDAVID